MKPSSHWILAPLLLVLALPAAAVVEGAAGTCPDTGSICFWRQPKLAPPAGWALREAASARYRAAVFTPTAKPFAAAEAVLYAKAVPKANDPASTLRSFMSDDLAEFRRQYPDLGVQSGLTFNDGDRRVLPAVRFVPAAGSKAQWETVAYGEEGGYYLIFSLSARTRAAHDTALPAFRQMVAGYHAGTAK